jgi:hypothetical protein
MVDIAVDFSKREGYQLQPAKRAELVSDLVIPIWVALSTTGIILLSIFQKPSFVTIVLILDLTGRITFLTRIIQSLYYALAGRYIIQRKCR